MIDLGLRGPTLGVLQRQGILSVVQLIKMTPDQLMSMRRVGPSRVVEIRQALQAHGLDLQVESSAPLTRVWESSYHVRLTCCEYGECTLELKTAGASAAELDRIAAAFVDAHRACPRLGGRAPVVSESESTRPQIPLAAATAESAESAEPEEATERRRTA